VDLTTLDSTSNCKGGPYGSIGVGVVVYVGVVAGGVLLSCLLIALQPSEAPSVGVLRNGRVLKYNASQ
jgi:hypothetical protein